jgi:hypothetical protein
MRTLIYVPIIHSIADMGSLGKELNSKSVSDYGNNLWQKHTNAVNGYWEAIEFYFKNIELPIKGIKIYQDGMFVEGEMAMKIIDEGIKSGSRNSIIVSNLIDRGAILMKTEDLTMVKNEYDGLQSVLKSKSNLNKLFQLFRYKISKPILLSRRDTYIADRIAETLGHDETGILFIGAYHNVMKKLPKYIDVIELKKIAKIREYEKAIRSYPIIKAHKIEQLTQYMIKKTLFVRS